MSLLRELFLFLGLQVSQLKDGIFITQTKYIKEMIKKVNMDESKPICTPIIIGFKLRKNDDVNELDQYGN